MYLSRSLHTQPPRQILGASELNVRWQAPHHEELEVSEMRRLACAVVAVAGLGMNSSYAQIYTAEKPTGAISEQDLLAVTRMSGMMFERYDYELPFDFCFNVFLETRIGADQAAMSPAGHLCALAGSHRLMILWQRIGDEVKVAAHTSRRDGPGGGGITLKTVRVPNIFGESVSAIPKPTFSLGTRTLMADFGYTTANRTENDGKLTENVGTRLKVFMELRPNPDQTQSAGGSHVQ